LLKMKKQKAKVSCRLILFLPIPGIRTNANLRLRAKKLKNNFA
jgi:hypothetical protein